MACFNIVDHRNHSNSEKCDAVLEAAPVKISRTKLGLPSVPDMRFLCKTTVAKAIVAAQQMQSQVVIWLYDPGSISKDEIRECRKSSS